MEDNKIALGEIRIPCGSFGNWAIEEVVVNLYQEKISKVRSILNGCEFMEVDAGRYIRLVRKGEVLTVVMSNTKMEVMSNNIAIQKSKGRVLVAGLGMGMVLEGMLKKKDVKHITVVEIDKTLLNHVSQFYKNERITFIHGDINEYEPKEDEFWDFIWFDIWDDIAKENKDNMQYLQEKLENHCAESLCWSADLIEILEESQNRENDWEIDI